MFSLGSSHNWNTLFVGTNAVADAMAQRYNAPKSHVLDAVSWVLTDQLGWDITSLPVPSWPGPSWSCTAKALGRPQAPHRLWCCSTSVGSEPTDPLVPALLPSLLSCA